MTALECAKIVKDIANKVKSEKILGDTLNDEAQNISADIGQALTNYVGDKDYQVFAQKTDEGKFRIVAIGQCVPFLEFGAGVTYEQPYPIARPDGIVGIGEYGHGNGKKPFWRFKIGDNLYKSEGNPPYMFMYNAFQRAKKTLIEKYRSLLK